MILFMIFFSIKCFQQANLEAQKTTTHFGPWFWT